MSAKHTPPGDDSFRASLLRNLGGGAALIVLVAAVFFGVGRLGADDGAPEVAGSAGDEDATSQAQQDEDPAPDPGEPEADEDEEPAPEPEEPDEPDVEEEPEPEEDPAEDDAEEADEAAESEPDEPAAAASGLQPSDISVQVLDGVGTDSGAASQRVAGELDDLGYRIIARNPALAYEETTVLWTSGNEDRARKVAADLGVSAVRQQPGNLSEQVDVHVVVGADRA